MKAIFVTLLVICSSTFAGAPLLNCAIPVNLSARDRAELGLKFNFSFETCFKYYMTGGNCDKRCVTHFTDLCTGLTQVCADIPIPAPSAVASPSASSAQPSNITPVLSR